MTNEPNRKPLRYAPPSLTVVGSLRGAAESLPEPVAACVDPAFLNRTDLAGRPATLH